MPLTVRFTGRAPGFSVYILLVLNVDIILLDKRKGSRLLFEKLSSLEHRTRSNVKAVRGTTHKPRLRFGSGGRGGRVDGLGVLGSGVGQKGET